MKQIKLLLLSASVVCFSCSTGNKNNSEDQPSDSTKNDTLIHKNVQLEQNFEKAWTNFAKAVMDEDLETVKSLSSECILCPVCLTNTLKEVALYEDIKKKNPNHWYEKYYLENMFVPIDKFMEEDFPLILKPDLKSRMLDTSKTKFHDNNVNRKLYDKGCIVPSSELDKSNLREAIVLVTDHSGESEGYQKAFAFIQTKQGYKFCGYSTIP